MLGGGGAVCREDLLVGCGFCGDLGARWGLGGSIARLANDSRGGGVLESLH